MGSKPSVIAEMCQESLLQMGGVRKILLHFEGDGERKNQDRKQTEKRDSHIFGKFPSNQAKDLIKVKSKRRRM